MEIEEYEQEEQEIQKPDNTTICGYCEGFSSTTFMKSCKFIILNEIGKETKIKSKVPHPRAEDQTLADDDDRRTQLRTINEFEFISIPCHWSLPSYSPCLIYTLKINVGPEESVYKIQEIMDIQKRWPDGYIPKEFIVNYFQYTLKMKNVRSILNELPDEISSMQDIYDMEGVMVNQQFKKEIVKLIALNYKSNTFIRLLRFFPSTFLCKFNHRELSSFEEHLKDPSKVHYLIFKNLFRNKFNEIEPETEMGQTLFPKEKYSWRIGCANNLTEWKDPYFDYHPKFPLLNPKKLSQLDYMTKEDIEIISDALKVYNIYEIGKKNGHTLMDTSMLKLPVLNYLIDNQIMISPNQLITSPNNTLGEGLERMIGDPFELIDESELWKKLDKLHHITVTQIEDYSTCLIKELTELVTDISGEHIILADNVTTANYFQPTGLLIHYFENDALDNIGSTLSYIPKKAVKKARRVKPQKEDNPFEGKDHVIILRANKVTVRNFNSILDLIPCLETTSIYMFGDYEEHPSRSMNSVGYGNDSSLFRLLYLKDQKPFQNCVRRVVEDVDKDTIYAQLKDIFSKEREAWGLLTAKHVHNAQEATIAYNKWITDHKSIVQKKPIKPTIQIFCSSTKFRFDFVKAIKQKSEVSFHAQVFHHNDRIIVTDMGIIGTLKKAHQKVIEDNSDTNWVDIGTKNPVKTHLNEYQLKIDTQMKQRKSETQIYSELSKTTKSKSKPKNCEKEVSDIQTFTVNTSAHPDNIKHAMTLLYKDHIGDIVDIAFLYVDYTTTLQDIFSVAKYVRKEIIFLMDSRIWFDRIRRNNQPQPKTLLSYLLQ